MQYVVHVSGRVFIVPLQGMIHVGDEVTFMQNNVWYTGIVQSTVKQEDINWGLK